MNEQAKKTLLRKLPYGLYVVGVKDEEEATAFTATWLTQASFSPPLVVLAVRADSGAYRLLTRGRVFSVCLLARDQQEVAQTFFKPPPYSEGKLGPYPARTAVTGAPILEDCLGYLDCEVRSIVPGGDHHLIIGEVVEAEVIREGELLRLEDTPWQYGG
jgi:flavin reductase (DIM6/NTAB) family NADH-FMN oxidoreductase RutF